MSHRFSIETKIDTLGFEKFGTVPFETSADDEPLFIELRNENPLGSWSRAIEPLTVSSQEPSFRIEGPYFQESGFERRPEVNFGSPGFTLELRYHFAVQPNLHTGDRSSYSHLDRVNPDHQTDQEGKKVDHVKILREPAAVV